ncbi:MAG: hypothetical protein LBK53_08250 [Heliobacteriaceae bacterium]|jgi:hypothetical protein|nr:hypothetical protein [Heliobacteriaceae bacterium]
MLKFIKVLFIIIIVSLNYVCAEEIEVKTTADAARAQRISHDDIQKIMARIQNNFKQDSSFMRYINIEYSQLMTRRQLKKDAVFPKVNKAVKGYDGEYPAMSTAYVLKQDEEFLNSLKDFVETYCENSIRYKDTAACSAERVKLLFTK